MQSGGRVWCHDCGKHVHSRAALVDALVCAECGGSFVELAEGDDPSAWEPVRAPSATPSSGAPSATAAPAARSRFPDGPPATLNESAQQQQERMARATAAPARNPIQQMLQDLVARLQGRNEAGAAAWGPLFGAPAGGGAFVMDLGQILGPLFGGGAGGMAPGTAPGDYVWGNQMEGILNQLFAQGGPQGPPPADADAVRALPRESVGPADVDAAEECSVCKEAFAVGDVAMRLPCKHRFHEDCVGPWLKLRNTCPVCRHELPAAADSARPAVAARPPGASSAAAVGGGGGGARPAAAAVPRPVVDDVPSPPNLSDEDEESDEAPKSKVSGYDAMFM